MRDLKRASEVGWDQESKERRARNRESAQQVLMKAGIEFENKNEGAHLIVRHRKDVADLWPGTGLWQVRPRGKQGRGVFNLLKHLNRPDERY